jgi:2-hydroxy-3-oxopropionate reductase
MVSIKVGFIGLGNLGMVVAKKLVLEKVPLTVYDLNKAAVDEMVAAGAKAPVVRFMEKLRPGKEA